MGSVPVFTILFMLLLIFRANTAWALTDPPPNITNITLTPSPSQIVISWTTPPPDCALDEYRTFVILRNTASILDKPSNGTTYAAPSYIGASKVVKSNTGACPPATSPWTDTGLLSGQKYYYKVFTGSTIPKYSTGVEKSATPSGVVTTKGTGTILRRTSEGDNTCGGPNNACHNVKTHNSINTESAYWTSNWGTGTGGSSKYGKIVCETCHQPHSTKNIYLIQQVISFPDGTTNPDWPAGSKWTTVDYRYRSGTAGSAPYVMGDDSDNHTTSTRICEICHSQTKFHRYNTTNQLAGNKAHNNAKQCTECHDHQTGFKPGEGGAPCDVCHSTQANPMKGVLTNSTNTYHMVMENSDITSLNTPQLGAGYDNRYPNMTQPTGSHKRCLYCHVEMENYSKKANKTLTSTSGRAYNLRKTISSAPSTQNDTSQTTNMDYNSTFPGGGICTSCHQYAQTKDTTKRTTADKTINSPVIDPSSFEQTTHNYIVEGGGYGSQGEANSDATTFKANCTKCHNDTLAKAYQSATYKFGLHDTELRRLNAPMSLATTGNPTGAAKGTATRGAANTITITGTWATYPWAGRAITISGGLGSNQTRLISTNTTTVSNISTITVTQNWAVNPDSTSYYLLGDPIEEEVCFRCHSTSTTSNPNQASYKDFYNTKTFTNTRALGMEQLFNTVNNPYGHLIANYSGLHRADEAIAAPPNATSQGWFSNTGTGKHVGCTDCHNPHAARKPGGDRPEDVDNKKGNGVLTSDASIAAPYATLTDSTKTGWTQNQWRGYVVRILSGTGAGQDRMILSNNTAGVIAVFTSWETYNIPTTNSFYIISPLGHPTYGNMLSNANDDAWGVTIASSWPTIPLTLSGTAEYMPTQLAGTFFTKSTKLTGNSDKVYNLCFKCHSAYGWGTSGTPFTIPDAPTGAAVGTYGTGPSADIAARFNPNNLAHHAVYSRGKNQPINANYGSTTAYSYYNSAWPYWALGGAPTISISSTGVATLTVAMTDINNKPLPVLPGWFVWIGTQDLPNVWGTWETAARRGNKVPGSSTSGWFEITSITSLTQFQVTPAATVTATSGFAITAGFGNTMVPPYGPWSVISCVDCHDTDSSTDPSGPHASARKWILRKFETQDFPWFNGTSVIRVRYAKADAGSAGGEGQNILCLNCHRQDVYGTALYAPSGGNAGAALANSADYINMYWKQAMSRQAHNVSPAGDGYALGSTAQGIICMNCHAGGALISSGVRPNIGEIHGTSIGRSLLNSLAQAAGFSYRGKRFLVGGAWVGLKRGSTSATTSCSMIPTGSSSFNSCTDNGDRAGSSATPVNANYDFESGTDY